MKAVELKPGWLIEDAKRVESRLGQLSTGSNKYNAFIESCSNISLCGRITSNSSLEVDVQPQKKQANSTK